MCCEPPVAARAEPASPEAGRRLKDAALRVLSLPWDMGFAALGALRPATPARWSSPGGRRVLVVAPHPDDEVYGCGGILLLHREAGDDVTVAHVTDGRRSGALGLGPEDMAARRRDEAGRAALALGLRGHEWLGFPEGAWERSAVAGELARVLDSYRPHVVYAPSRVDFHPEHLAVAGALADALARRYGEGAGVRDSPSVRIYAVQVPLTSVLTNLVGDTSRVSSGVREAMACYRTQLGALRSCLRVKRHTARRYRAGSRAEAFWEITTAGYRRLHATLGEEERRRTPYRGVRRLPFTDPLAYLVGRTDRIRLAALAEEELDLGR